MFKIVKTTGNYYGSQFPVYAGAQISNAAADGSLVKGSQGSRRAYRPHG